MNHFSQIFQNISSFFSAFFLAGIIFIFSVFFSPQAFATGAGDILKENGVKTSDLNLPELNNEEGAGEKVNAIIFTVIEIILSIAGFISLVFLIIGGTRYTISTGDEDMINGARAMILYALSGLVVVIFSYAILTNVIAFLETGD
jgi:uncharacterized membrane protein